MLDVDDELDEDDALDVADVLDSVLESSGFIGGVGRASSTVISTGIPFSP